ncbi:MAG: hypothetical protein COV98_00745 [Candidatus Altarchaeum sp. CG12_big_fil_rev_8_21_14_0_65_33_22]|nr:MAG: hypothetical protein COV98_00745 [Candidatus Altarchaeum sp. CG12_big_fil_rev_8_21_14_0_65_33_22]PIX48992.1 MAG: hypothetical protein COZ53_02110 [Candidatus Altarchaeum sp. CG_4_8_14_3_um_filter_33_2054]
MFFSCFLLFLRTNFYFLFITNICIPIFNIFLRTDHENFTDIMSTSEKKIMVKSINTIVLQNLTMTEKPRKTIKDYCCA